MINGIKNIKNFGVFSDYVKPSDINDFLEKNIIYGWNYSGKTTLSRIFQSLEHNVVNSDYSKASFLLETTGGARISESNMHVFNNDVRVFNSDFIERNLSWNGDMFQPILLLGDETIEAEKEIQANEVIIERCRTGYASKSGKIRKIEEFIRNEKTKKASQIKKTLSLVETFTATHINQLLPSVRAFPEAQIKDKDKLKELLKKALASESDKLDIINKVNIKGNIAESVIDVPAVLSKTPEMTNTISYLAENANVSRWVKEGLELHTDKENCEFCGNAIESSRLKSLKSHFSKDLQEHESKIKALILRIDSFKINFSKKHIKEYYQAFHDEVNELQTKLTEIINSHNTQIQAVIDTLNKKLESQYSEIHLPSINVDYDSEITRLITQLNEIADKNNTITNNFNKEKRNSVNALKNHFVAEYVEEIELSKQENIERIHSNHKDKYEKFAKALQSKNLELEAAISNAQKGREELNQFIDKFLDDSNIRIEVIKDHKKERFVLMRGSERARNLSEGEKTAIAFSFFLVKLWEITNLEETIVYIDDPISSLDSNHLFQVNAVIKDFFFFKDADDGNEWKLKVKQIFFSTHNFEFLSLLKELPMANKSKTNYFLVKRISLEKSTLINMPESLKKYSSEYHYLWNIIYSFYTSESKDDIEVLLGLPNAMRRFIELYTYSKIPCATTTSVDIRADVLFGKEKSKRIMKVLHHFSHLNNINRMSQNSDLISDIENVVNDLVDYISKDKLHYDALMEGV